MGRIGNRLQAASLALAGLALALLLALPAVLADEASDKIALDALFAELKLAPDARTARTIDQKIWIYWTVPADPMLASRMADALVARRNGDTAGAIGLLDRLIADHPDYAEAWNQRATLRFLTNDFEGSLADIAKVLELEPRHFGALAGRALIYLQQDKRALAIRDMARAVDLHPFLPERHLFPELIDRATRI